MNIEMKYLNEENYDEINTIKDKKIDKLFNSIQNNDTLYEIKIKMRNKDSIYNVLKILSAMKYCGDIGHTTSGTFDEGKDKITFFCDGDGSFKIEEINIKVCEE